MNNVIQADCLDIMKGYNDNQFDLCLSDPPYGIFTKEVTGFKKGSQESAKEWDKRPDKIYFDEMRRISKNQIIWGGNYFGDYLGVTKEPLIWDKKTGNNYFADGEMAWSSFQGTLRIFRHQWCGAFKDSERDKKPLHPTQKPIELFSWCLERYSKEGDSIIDPFAGSGTTAISCINMNRKYTLIEKKQKYTDLINRRIKNHLDGNLIQHFKD